MAKPGIESVWSRIAGSAGETFSPIRGAEFTYEVVGGHVVLHRTPQQIPKSHFGKALELVPLQSTVLLQSLRGPSFIYAILMDPRIRRGDW